MAMHNIPELLYPNIHISFLLALQLQLPWSRNWVQQNMAYVEVTKVRAPGRQETIHGSVQGLLIVSHRYLLPWPHQFETSYTLTFCHVTFFGWRGRIMTIWNSWKEKFGHLFVSFKSLRKCITLNLQRLGPSHNLTSRNLTSRDAETRNLRWK
jgi:hypothetical protein